ncbi:hypothetical protein ACIP5Y_36440 [Nocardia sp. NPDC088792]
MASEPVAATIRVTVPNGRMPLGAAGPALQLLLDNPKRALGSR